MAFVLNRAERNLLRRGAVDLTSGSCSVGDHLENLGERARPSIPDAQALRVDTALAGAVLDDLGWAAEAEGNEFALTVPEGDVEAMLVYLLHYHAQGMTDALADKLDGQDWCGDELLKADVEEWRGLDELLRRVRGGSGLITPGALVLRDKEVA